MLGHTGEQAFVGTLDLFPSLRSGGVDGFVGDDLGQRLAVERAGVAKAHIIALGGGALGDLEISALSAHALDHGVDLSVGRLNRGDLGGEAVVVGKLEVGTHVDRELDGGGETGLDLAFLDIDEREHLELGLVEAVAVGFADNLLLELVLQLLAEALGHHGGRSLAGAKAGQADLLGEFAQDGVVFAIDLTLVEGDGQRFASLVDVGDLNVHGI